MKKSDQGGIESDGSFERQVDGKRRNQTKVGLKDQAAKIADELTERRNQTKVGLKGSPRTPDDKSLRRRNQTKVGLKVFSFDVPENLSYEEIRPRWD